MSLKAVAHRRPSRFQESGRGPGSCIMYGLQVTQGGGRKAKRGIFDFRLAFSPEDFLRADDSSARHALLQVGKGADNASEGALGARDAHAGAAGA